MPCTVTRFSSRVESTSGGAAMAAGVAVKHAAITAAHVDRRSVRTFSPPSRPGAAPSARRPHWRLTLASPHGEFTHLSPAIDANFGERAAKTDAERRLT